jgi:SAM-dependent MidA family methyltransferase
VTGLRHTIQNEIASSGPITFARYMELALYHPSQGYYAAGAERTGWRGPFLTSPEIDPGFGTLWASGFEQVWRQCDRPRRFDVIELGPGEGSFASAILNSATGPFADALHYSLVERVPAVAQRQRAVLGGHPRAVWAAGLDDVQPVAAGCLFANEVLDNTPVRLVERRWGELFELLVGMEDGDLTLVPASSPLDEAVERFLVDCNMTLREGCRAEVGLAAMDLTRDAARIVERGAVIFIDYGHSAEALEDRRAGSLLCYSARGVDDLALAYPGEKDITSHVNWTAISHALSNAGAAVIGPVEQRRVLHRLGLRDVVDGLKAASHAGSGAGVIRALSRRGAVAALADPSGLGSLGVLVGLNGIAAPDFLPRDERDRSRPSAGP